MKKVSELLKETRLSKGFTLDNVEQETRIKKKFLQAMEEGKFHTLPSETYALGFVKNYAEFLGLNTDRVSALYRREYEREQVSIVPEFRKTQHRYGRRIAFGPKGFFVVAVFLIILGYLFLQYSSVLFGPELTIETPQQNQVIEGNVVEVKGTSAPYATVLVNDEEVYVGLDGSFRKSLYLFSGEQQITIVAKNRYGKESQEVRTVTLK